jgi:Lipid A 3-O-deacylase (PagL)
VPGDRTSGESFVRKSVVAAAAWAALTAALAPSARAQEARWLSFAASSGEDVNALRIGGGWRPDWECEWLARIGAVPFVSGHVEYLNSRGTQSVNDVVWNAGLMAGARWPLAPDSRWRPYIEFGIGGVALTHASIGDRHLGNALLFDERLTTGLALDAAGRYELATFVEHRSNAGLVPPNQGLTTYGLELRVGLR